MKSQSSTSAASFQSSSLLLTLDLDPADVSWDLERYACSSLFDIERITMHGGLLYHSPLTRMSLEA
jgi:hypothetical protein